MPCCYTSIFSGRQTGRKINIGVVTKIWAEWPRNQSSIHEEHNFFLSFKSSRVLGGPPSSYSVDTWGSVLRGRPLCEDNYPPPFNIKVKNAWIYTVTSHATCALDRDDWLTNNWHLFTTITQHCHCILSWYRSVSQVHGFALHIHLMDI